jgi:hypothetical protein
MEAIRLTLLLLALACFVFGFVVWARVQPVMRKDPTLRFSPVWKQRSLFGSSSQFQWYLIGTGSVSLGSLLMVVAILLAFV